MPNRERLHVAGRAEKIDSNETCAISEQEPTWTKRTVSPLAPTVQTNGMPVVNDLMPSPLVPMTAVKLPPTLPPAGRFVMNRSTRNRPAHRERLWAAVGLLIGRTSRHMLR